MGKDRSHNARSVHADEINKRGLTEAQVRALLAEEQPPTNTTPSGALPQPATPYGIAQRVNDDGKIVETVRLTTIASNLRRFWLTHRLRRKDGSYGEEQRQAVKCTDAMKSNNSAEVGIRHAWRAGRTVDLVHIEGKFTSDPTDDGGGYDETPKPYVEATLPGLTSFLAQFNTGAVQGGTQAKQLGLNTKLSWGQFDWGDTAGAGTHDNHRLAKWRYGKGGVVGWDIDQSIPDQTVSVSTNYWSSAQHIHPPTSGIIPAGCLVIQKGTINTDPCVKLHQDPLDPEEPVHVQFVVNLPLSRGGGQQPTAITVSIEDTDTGFVLCSCVISFSGLGIPGGVWTPVRSEAMQVSPSYVPVTGAGQVVRFHPDRDAVNNYILLDKILVSNEPGGYSQHPRDAQAGDTPTVRQRTGSGRGGAGYGTTGGEAPAGGQRVRVSTE